MAKGDRDDEARELLKQMLAMARTHRMRLEQLTLANTSVGTPDGWLCLVGVDATTRVRLRITMQKGAPFFELAGEARCNEWHTNDDKKRFDTGDGTVPLRGAEPGFLDRKNLVCLRPDDFGYWELKDKALLAAAGFHSLLPGLNLAQRLVVSHFRGYATKGVWGRPVPGVSQADWAPPIRGLELKA